MVDNPALTLDRSGPIFAVHAALQASLRMAFPVKQFVHHSVPARFSKATWARLGERTPFVALGFTGLEPGRDNARSYNARAVFTVFLGVKQPVIEAMLTGDSRAPGLLGMMGMAIGVLHGQRAFDPTSFLCIGTWSVGAVQNLYDEGWANDELGVVGADVSMLMQVADDTAATLLPDYLRQGTAWDLPLLPATITDLRGA